MKINKTIPLTLWNNLLTFRDTGQKFELKGDLLKLITNKNYNVDIAGLSDKKIMFVFAKELNFDLKARSIKSTRDRTLIKLLKSPSLIIFASSVSKTKFLLSDPDVLCNGLTLILLERKLIIILT